MADKSKKEQYDIVEQAEDVLKLYIKRCFDVNRRFRNKKPKSNIKKKTIIISAIISCFSLIAAAWTLIYFL